MFEHLHEAPGDDAQFVYGVPPWRPDGSPNPPGIYFTPEDPVLTRYGRDPDGDSGWSCTRRHTTARMRRRICVRTCRGTDSVKRRRLLGLVHCKHPGLGSGPDPGTFPYPGLGL